MLRDARNAKTKDQKWIESQSYLPAFSGEDWDRLEQIDNLLRKFEEFTHTVSKRQPQLSLVLPIYYELHDLLHDAAYREGEFASIDRDIAQAADAAMRIGKLHS
ncbi:hypothetical protein V1525DRAFT_230666 [Lipomyces kononenkoae]|uniref:Uncharacterized protein n=1 Tax=Lipomyces kononenkoae TaxID=34357 RepID=A0ACC3SWY8_LIPKO